MDKDPVYVQYKNNRVLAWECVCDCGNHAKIVTHNLVSGATRSCGCLVSELAQKRLHTLQWIPMEIDWRNNTQPIAFYKADGTIEVKLDREAPDDAQFWCVLPALPDE